jgi:hypothetical protein
MRYLIHWYPFCSGGLCDRILGLASTICIADMLKMQVLIRWDHSDLSSGFKINDKYDWYKNQVNFRHLNMTNIDSIEYFKKVNIVEDWNKDNIMYWSSVNLYNYCLENPFLKYLVHKNYIQKFSEAIRLILNEIFIINPKILENVEENYEIGLHIRTGDKQIYNKENEEFYRNYITNILNIVNTKLNKNDKIFISTDCLLTFEIAKENNLNVIYNKGCIIHTSEEINEEGLHKVLKDLLELCKCNKKLFLGWNSNFSRISALYNINREFICYEYENEEGNIKEISKEKLFSYFSTGKYT